MTSDRRLPRAVIWLGVVSLATDASSEMIYPLLPLFLTTVLGAGVGLVGAIEGVAEATASLLKLISGRLADRARRKKPLTVLGYGLSSLVRPLAGLARASWMILAVRVADRIGKGIRSSPRDALLADATPADRRGRAYGFHRAMDNTGAVIGPAIATLLLTVGRQSLRAVFLWAAVPGVLAMVALLFGVREEGTSCVAAVAAPVELAIPGRSPRHSGLTAYWVALALFGLGNASDAFLLLRARALGVPAALIPALWMLHNAVKALGSTAGGALSDRLGRRPIIVLGWAIYAFIYLGFGLAKAPWHIWSLFVLYGVYYSLTEGSEKALVADLAGAGARGRAFGWYHAIVGVTALPASLAFGLLAAHVGAIVPFVVAALLAAAGATVLWLGVAEQPPVNAPAA